MKTFVIITMNNKSGEVLKDTRITTNDFQYLWDVIREALKRIYVHEGFATKAIPAKSFKEYLNETDILAKSFEAATALLEEGAREHTIDKVSPIGEQVKVFAI